ncbi:MAG TPA: HlyD family efflux transporter periplasmic adaptor subunit [Thiopseudomonas sp.]|nr:HlyD family efflux transporter periplasmic adaptor subunit [Thiopseudomonas sp.]
MNSFIKRRGRSLLVALGLLLGIGLMAIFILTRQAPQRDNTAFTVPTMSVIEVKSLPFQVEARGHGIARPTRTWQAIANVPGRVVYKHPRLDDGVLLPAETLLLEIDPSRYQLAEAEALGELASLDAEQAQLAMTAENTQRLLELEQARLQLAEKELARFQRLAKSGSVSQSRRDEEERATLAQREMVQSLRNQLQLIPSSRQRLEAQIERANTRLAQARQDIKDTRFVAPFDLRLAAVEAELYQYVNAGQRLFQADGIATAEIVAQVPLTMLLRLMQSPKQSSVKTDALDLGERLDFSVIDAQVSLVAGAGVQWPARVVRIARGLNPDTRAAQVVVEVDEPYRSASPPQRPVLQPDMYVQVRLSAQLPEPQLVIPATAVHQGEVYLLDEQQRLQRRAVEVAFEQHDMAVVSKGLNGGETLIIDDLSPAINGMLVKPLRNAAIEQQLQQRAMGELP